MDYLSVFATALSYWLMPSWLCSGFWLSPAGRCSTEEASQRVAPSVCFSNENQEPLIETLHV